ncbi:hypothetical protein CVT25_012137 [Psilocybe cyanescens]|uniref:Plasmid pRiA4b Orf3-like domain-containing protein n=1 Tax=Psilocybe cyanescens TaxID=93625 RepID=A0A409XJ75_PSICY|nr:hypothetical protein CVT25_012137 [Psilocybe cyanescens]
MDRSAMYRSMGMTPPPRSMTAPNRRPKYVKLAPGDDGEFLPDAFFEEYVPISVNDRSPHFFFPTGTDGSYTRMGTIPGRQIGQIVITHTLFASLSAVNNCDTSRWDSSSHASDDNKSPESQFMKVILDRKASQYSTSLSVENVGFIFQNSENNWNRWISRDSINVIFCAAYTFHRNGEHRVWRLFKVSSGITLSAFQDKAIAPIMGWVRNFHSYTFTDFRDGALFGPEVGYKYLPDSKYKLAHIFGKEGDQIGYLYDYGDKWYHRIEILKIFPPEESSGAIEVIDGKGMCPGENLRGNLNYARLLDEYDDASYSKKAEKKREILSTPNYDSFGKPPSLFDPAVFDLGAAKERVAEALSSTSSVRAGSKKFHMPFAHDGERMIERMEQRHLKKGQSILNQRDEENYGFWNETISNKRDGRKEAVCSYCGKPAAPEVELKACAGCQQVL